MHPILFEIGWFQVHTYGLLLMISFIIGIYFMSKIGEKQGIDPNNMVDLGIVIIISSLVGARTLYVMFHFSEYENNLLDIINPMQSDGTFGIAGLSILGGVILGSFATLYFVKLKKLPALKIFNIAAPFVALGIGITRIGCYFHGCCFGLACSPEYGVIFPAGSPAGYTFPNTPIYPTQLYASAAGFLIFGILLKSKSNDFFKDNTFYLLLILLGLSRFIVDFYRHFESSIIMYQSEIFQLSSNQLISLMMIVLGIYSIYRATGTKK